ncbi:MAG: 5-formyltetrahydrofolate cyclo-ligase [bacterium]
MLTNLTLKNKAEVRKIARLIRSNINICEISRDIVEQIKKEDFYKNSKNILAYYPFGDEVDITNLFSDETKNWYLPRLEFKTKKLKFYKYKSDDFLEKNEFGIFEPAIDKEKLILAKTDLIIIPALAVDMQGIRLGYGAGFYDRFLIGLKHNTCKITAIPEQLVCEKLPADSWDMPVNYIVSQNKAYFIKK